MIGFFLIIGESCPIEYKYGKWYERDEKLRKVVTLTMKQYREIFWKDLGMDPRYVV